MFSDFVLNATKYIKICDVCGEPCMTKNMQTAKLVHYGDTIILYCCLECIRKLKSK